MNTYFDNAATTPISERALERYIEVSRTITGNPSSIHREGVKAHDYLESQRRKIADILSVKPECLTFTSGASESISRVMESLLWLKNPGTVIISRIEHEAVKSYAGILKERGWNVKMLKCPKGHPRPEDLRELLTEDTKLVAVMSVNNVTGALTNVGKLVEVVREYEKETGRKIFFFSDSVQALGKTNLDLVGWDVDGASFSSHKIQGPRGVGMLYLKNHNFIHPLAVQGGQEKGVRGGTENVPGIAAFAEALQEVYENRAEKEERASRVNSYLRNELEALGFEILSKGECTPYILSVATPLPAEVFTRMLIDKGFCVSSGSACSNNAKGKGEGTLQAMGYQPKYSENSIRISLPENPDEESAAALINAIKEILNGR